MTNQTAELIAEPALEFPCPPLGAAELSAAEAERMACMFKALADPVRLRLFSGVAAHQSGEASCLRHPERRGVPAHGQPPPEEAEGGGPHHLRAPRHLGVLPGRAGGAARDGQDAGADRLAPHRIGNHDELLTGSEQPPDRLTRRTAVSRPPLQFPVMAEPYGNYHATDGRPSGDYGGEHLVVRSVPVRDPGDLIGWLPEPAALAWIRHGAGLLAGARRRVSRCPPARTGSPSARSGCARSSRTRTSRTRPGAAARGWSRSAASPSTTGPRARCSSCPARCSAGTGQGTRG